MKRAAVNSAVLTVAIVALLMFGTPDARAEDIEVDGEILLLIDVSGSVDGTEYSLMMGAYESVFRNDAIVASIQAGGTGATAVAVAMWSAATEQSLVVPWARIHDDTSAEAFADAIAGITRPFSGLTGIGQALSWGGGLFASNGFDGVLTIIDISGDGQNNSGIDVATGRAAALASVDAINGLPVGATSIRDYYEANVIGGSMGEVPVFVKYAAAYADFESAFEQKLYAESQAIVAVTTPEPSTFLLFGLGALGAGLAARRRRRRLAAKTA